MEFTFVVLLTLQCLILLLHDWISMPPLNDIAAMRRTLPARARMLMVAGNLLPPLIVLVLETRLYEQPKPLGIGIYFVAYFVITLVMIYMSWYHPYLAGATAEEKERFRAEYGRTLQLLPPRGDNPRPNAIHVFLHLIILINAALAVPIGFNLR
jgi:hypothetical protein